MTLRRILTAVMLCRSGTRKFNERVKMQLFFNILNHPSFDVFSMNTDLCVPNSVGTAIFTPDLGAASNPVLGTGGSRHIQLGAKII
jgi:hypothetical protein